MLAAATRMRGEGERQYLYRVPAVVQNKDDGLEAVAEHHGQLLDRQLERTVPNEQDRPVEPDILRGERSAECAPDSPADRAPKDLAHENRFLWEGDVQDTKAGRS